MKFEKITEGFVYDSGKSEMKLFGAGPRCVVLNGNDLLCSFFAQKALGTNDYEVMLARSHDGGETWTECKSVWPEMKGKYSIYGSISRSESGELFLYGTRTPVTQSDESFWCDATQGLKQNELYYSRSQDDGKTWTDPCIISMPISGSAEAPGTMCITKSGRWIAPYSPYNTFDALLKVERNQVVAMRSDNQGEKWNHSSMLFFDEKNSNGAEAWVIELDDGRLLGTSWHQNQNDGSDYPNTYALSGDKGTTWSKTMSTEIWGQSTGLAPWRDGKALFIYNQRKHGETGVWMALVKPTEADFGIELNEIIWKAESNTQSGTTSGGHSEWTDFSFGEPSVTVLPDDTLLVLLWCSQPSGSGIRYVKLKMME